MGTDFLLQLYNNIDTILCYLLVNAKAEQFKTFKFVHEI